MDFSGLLVGAISFLLIGVFHPVVIKAEYRFGKRCWPAFALAGLVCCIASVLAGGPTLSVLLAILGFTLFWSIHELFQQEQRVQRGWYPANPRRKS